MPHCPCGRAMTKIHGEIGVGSKLFREEVVRSSDVGSKGINYVCVVGGQKGWCTACRRILVVVAWVNVQGRKANRMVETVEPKVQHDSQTGQ